MWSSIVLHFIGPPTPSMLQFSFWILDRNGNGVDYSGVDYYSYKKKTTNGRGLYMYCEIH